MPSPGRRRNVILRCNYEELNALRAGARVLLEGQGESGCSVVAPPTERASVEAFVGRLEGDLAVGTLHEQREVAFALEVIVECLRAEMDAAVVAAHPAAEIAVAAYFDYAHAYAVLGRVWELGEEMEAMIEVVTGAAPTPEIARTFVFPD